ncbi:MAG: acyl carrier protein [Planctomycetota bacterium]|jgi:acyl carrier protein
MKKENACRHPVFFLAPFQPRVPIKNSFTHEGRMENSVRVREFIVENFLFGDGDALKEDTSFMEEGIIDSTGILELVFFLEESFGISVEDHELVPENMDSLRSVAGFIDRKLNGSSAAEA